MESWTQAHAADFPAQLDHVEIENRCASESFTWGPQALWLLCGLIWIFYFLVRDVPELARNTALIGAVATLLSAVGVWYDRRRRKRRTVLCPLGGRIGCYSGNAYQYSFAPEEMVRVRMDFFGWGMMVLKGLVPMVLIIVIILVVMLDGLRSPGPHGWQDIGVFLYAVLFAVFGFVAIFRSRITLTFFWVPSAKGKADKPAYFHPRELKKLETALGERFLPSSSNH